VRRVSATDAAAALLLTTFMVAISMAVRTTQPHARTMTAVGASLLAIGGLALAWWRAAPLVSYAVAVTSTGFQWPDEIRRQSGSIGIDTSDPR